MTIDKEWIRFSLENPLERQEGNEKLRVLGFAQKVS